MADQEPKLLDRRAVAAKLTVSQGTVENLVARGRFPKPMKIGNSSRWLETDIDEYIRWIDWQRKLSVGGVDDEFQEIKETQTDTNEGSNSPTAHNQDQTRPKRPKA